MRYLIIAALALACSACNLAGLNSAGTTTTAASTQQAVEKLADTAAAIADAAGVPKPQVSSPVADTALRKAIGTFEIALDVVDGVLDLNLPQLARNSPAALKVRAGVKLVDGFLDAAAAAQQAGSAADYQTALANAKAAVDDIRAAIAAVR